MEGPSDFFGTGYAPRKLKKLTYTHVYIFLYEHKLTADKIYTCIKISRSALKCDKTLKLVDEHCILIIMIIDKLMKENGIINTSMNKVILVYN